MNDSGSMRRRQGARYLDGDVDRGIEGKAAAFDLLAKGLAFDIFGGDELHAIGLSEFVDGENVGMVEGGGGVRFLLEAAQTALVAEQLRRQHLERDLTAQLGVLGEIHLAHAAGPSMEITL